MKIKGLIKISSLALMLCTAIQLQAADVDLTTAQNAAKSFLTRQAPSGRFSPGAAASLKLVKAEASVAKPDAVDYYIFNADKSYVVVAGDDQAPEILMYGAEGNIDLNNIPPAMNWLLNKYKYQIDGIKAGTLKAVSLPKTATTVVPPLVNANWDQTAPYNNHAPMSGSTHAYTGCPATSLAMCFYKWKWPKTYPALAAIPSSYYGLACEALPEREADWDNIIDEYTGPTNYSYTSEQADAVAWLMRYAGQACQMEYSTSGSGANDPEIHQACITFGYTDAKLLTLTELVSSGWSYTNGPQHYTDEQWNEWMLNELYNGRPIEYLAYDISGWSVSGHAFNVFGVDEEGKYFVNWGWSGDDNGYCTLHNFTTATGSTGQAGSYVFNYGEAMIIGIEPPSMTAITVEPAELNMSAAVNGSVTSTFTVKGNELLDAVTLSLSGDEAFSISTTSIGVDAAQAEDGVAVTVTYAPKSPGTDHATVTLTSPDAEDVTVALNGTATGPGITADPKSFDFGEIENGTSATQTMKVTGTSLTGDVTLTLLDDNGVFSLSTTTVTRTQALSDGANVTITFAPKDITSSDDYTASVKLSSPGVNDVVVSLAGSGHYTAPALTVTPTQLSFYAAPGKTVSKTFKVTGVKINSDLTLTLNDPKHVFSVSPATISARALADGGSANVTVSFNSEAEGKFTGSLSIDNDQIEPVYVSLAATASAGGTARDAFLDIANYATIDEAGATVSGMTGIYKFTEYPDQDCAWLTVSNYGAMKADSNQKWLTTSSLNQYGNTWSAKDIFLGDDAYFGSNSSFDVYGSGTQTFYVTNCTQVKFYDSGASGSNKIMMNIYECTLDAEGTPTAATTPTDTKTSATTGDEVVTSIDLDATKVYMVKLTGGGTYPDLYEIGFRTDLSVPKLTVTPAELTIIAEPGKTNTGTFHVKGQYLADDVNLVLTDENNVFSLSAATISAEEAMAGKDITVTFSSTDDDTFTGTVTLTSGPTRQTVALKGRSHTGGKASDAYLNIAKYATINTVGAEVSGMETIFSYTENADDDFGWLTVSNYGAMKADETQEWTSTAITATNSRSWTANDVFKGDDYYFGSAQSYALGSTGTYQYFYVTNCTQVKQFVYNSNARYPFYVRIYECTEDAQGNIAEGTEAVDTQKSTVYKDTEVITSAELDPQKIYKVELYNNNSYLYEIAFKTPKADSGLLGDVNLDGKVDIADINIVANIILGLDDAANYGTRAYINDDDQVNIADLNILVSIVLGQE